MTQLVAAFDPMMYDPTQGAGSLPVGRHPVHIEKAEVKANKANDGGYLEFLLRVIDGPAAGTTGAYRLNLYHSNPSTVEIANRQLSAICHVVNVFRLGSNGQDVSVLFNIPFIAEVGLQKGEEAAAKGYTEIKKVLDINGNEPKKAGNGPQQSQPTQQGGHGMPGNATGMQGQGVPQNGQQGGWQQGGGNGQQQPPAGGWAQQQPQNGQQGQNGGAAWGNQQNPQQGQQQQPPQQGGWQQNNQQPNQQQTQAAPGGWQQGGSNGQQGGGNAPWGPR